LHHADAKKATADLRAALPPDRSRGRHSFFRSRLRRAGRNSSTMTKPYRITVTVSRINSYPGAKFARLPFTPIFLVAVAPFVE